MELKKEKLVSDASSEEFAPEAQPVKPRRRWRFAVGLILLIIAAAALLTLLKKTPLLSLGSDYQAVFLDNNQIYFGKVSSTASKFINLKDVYYLQVEQGLQPVKDGDAPQQNILLVELGRREIHKPKNEMRINRDHILFIEDLQPDSQIVQGIKQLKEAPK